MCSAQPRAINQYDLREKTIRELNKTLHERPDTFEGGLDILNPDGAHNIAVGVEHAVDINVFGPVGYFFAGQNKNAHMTVHGYAGRSVAENIMSGEIRVKGDASESVGATGHGGFVVVEGNAGSRCGISMKGVDIVVGGNVGHMSAFMAQAGRLVICGDAAPGLGDSLYEAVIYVRGEIQGLGADAQEEPMTDDDYLVVGELLTKAGFDHSPKDFKRVASARKLYNWNVDISQEY